MIVRSGFLGGVAVRFIRTDMSHDASVHLPYGYYIRTMKGGKTSDIWYSAVRFTPPFFPFSGPVGDMLAKMYYAETAGK
jgi:hypothetical protein